MEVKYSLSKSDVKYGLYKSKNSNYFFVLLYCDCEEDGNCCYGFAKIGKCYQWVLFNRETLEDDYMYIG